MGENTIKENEMEKIEMVNDGDKTLYYIEFGIPSVIFFWSGGKTTAERKEDLRVALDSEIDYDTLCAMSEEDVEGMSEEEREEEKDDIIEKIISDCMILPVVVTKDGKE